MAHRGEMAVATRGSGALVSRETARYDYTLGSTRESAIVYDDDLKIQNWSDTNPARGQHHAFDLVRLHRFGDMDKDTPAETPVSERPSYRAMCEFAESLPKIRAARAAAEFEDLGPLPEPATAVNDDWLGETAAATPPPPSPYRVVSAAEFAGGEFTEPDWLIEDHLPARGIGLAWGLSGSDKTGGVFDMLTHTHRGVEWREKVARRVPSAMFVAEGEHMFKKRYHAYAKDRDIPIAELPSVITSAIDLRNGKQVAELAKELQAAGIRHCWFDTLQQCAPAADENSVKDMGEVITNLKWLAKQINGFCGAVHHAGKNLERGARGSSAWRPAVDVELYFESDGVRGTMKVEKLKDGAPYSVYPFERKVIGLGTRPNGKPITSVVVVQTDEAPHVKASKLPKVGTLTRAVYDLIKATGPRSVEDVRAAAVEDMTAPDPGKVDRRTGRVNETIDALKRQQLLFVVDGKLSTTQIVRGTDGQNF